MSQPSDARVTEGSFQQQNSDQVDGESAQIAKFFLGHAMSIMKILRTSRAASYVKRAMLRPLINQKLRPLPRTPRGTVVIAGLTKQKLHVWGKISPARFLPAFCNALRSEGYQTFFACSEAELASLQHCAKPVVVIMVYAEDDVVPASDFLSELLQGADVVFNHPRVGGVIRSKRRTHQLLTAAGIPMPELKDVADDVVFSNVDASSGAKIKVFTAGAPLDRTRYNTEFIDTRYRVNGKDYYTTVRLMCGGPYVTHSFVRARDVTEQNPSVHAKDSPRDSGLMSVLEQRLIEPNQSRFLELAQRTYDALGPGFYAHDILVEARSNRVLMCETGFKFDDVTFWEWAETVDGQIPGWKPGYAPEQAAIAAVKPFLEIVSSPTTHGVNRRGVLAPFGEAGDRVDN